METRGKPEWGPEWQYREGQVVELIKAEGVPEIIVGTLWKIVLPCYEDRDMHEKYYVEPWPGDPRYKETSSWMRGAAVTACVSQFQHWKSNKQTFDGDN